ncbi:MAG TPA: hypothetical protein PLD03_09710 [Thiomonas arsenitoxydans]|nr:hypothetical protein [Thiomonas arsenitoxydans]
MLTSRYLFLINLDESTQGKAFRPSELPDIDAAYVESFGKCATIEMPQGVIYIAGHARCGPKMWALASGGEDNRPNVPWAAFRGFGQDEAAGLAWSWLVLRGVA